MTRSQSQTEPKTRKLILFGVEDFAEIAYEYFTWDSGYEVAAFTVEQAYLKEKVKFGLPVIAFEDLESSLAPAEHDFFAAIVYVDLNRLRARVCRQARDKGYRLASYVSSRAFVWRNATIGQHCFIFENNSVQPFADIGDNVVLWSGNQVSHHARIGSHCFLSGNVAMGGWSRVEDYCFLGINSTLANNTRLGSGSWVAHGAVLSGNVPPSSFVQGIAGAVAPLDEPRLSAALRRASCDRKN